MGGRREVPIIRVTRSAVIDAPIERVWAVLRDFNSHTAWHPAVARSEIEDGAPSDQVGCVRSFELADGHRIREQLLALSDREHVSTYFLCRWAAGLGARVRGTVSTDEKARVARAHGCGVAIVARDGRFAEAVRGATGGRGAGVASDGLGRGAVEENLAAVAACGHRVSYSRASGAVDPVAPERLAEKSHTRSRPVVFHDTAAREALRDVAGRTLDAARRTVGPVVLPR